ncbi:hypothetical protein ASPZODRAFT_127482 [Penicilliopsis zonata CBS 506.65]|uniref:RRM domain-containing protein n=1 Tax=Penicilliopsis zonata CBS 506.65 TaxID=1073090 RepID=A0A1L9SW92_9EURO|nr:hypothetical protein ASPZODRAFT_127482 [Penicilliopsis zonata CBS 506.65]OJJ51414.1 hypothetical protein ASPZODRAFT_127482 [Penicilliopsis zonata CBS 506.65]
MLRPFHIRDLAVSPYVASESDTTVSTGDHSQGEDGEISQPQPHATVQISSSEYDRIAVDNPRARLMYVDNDDGELITVGSSFELDQRLDDPVDVSVQPELSQQYSDSAAPMHIFDIRRSNSVVEIWKKYETKSRSEQKGKKPLYSDGVGLSFDDGIQGADSALSQETDRVADEESAPFLAAFEAELAKMMDASPDAAKESGAHIEPSSSSSSQPADAASQQPRNPGDVFAQAVHNIVDGAEMIGSEIRSRLPELERQLHNAQRTLPEQVGSSVQLALTSLESNIRHLSVALQNVPGWAAQARAQGAQTTIPAAERVVDGLQMIAGELGEVGRTLYTSFEREFGNGSSNPQSSPSEPQNRPGPEHSTPAPAETAARQTTDSSASASREDEPQNFSHSSEPEATTQNDEQGSDVRSLNQTPHSSETLPARAQESRRNPPHPRVVPHPFSSPFPHHHLHGYPNPPVPFMSRPFHPRPTPPLHPAYYQQRPPQGPMPARPERRDPPRPWQPGPPRPERTHRPMPFHPNEQPDNTVLFIGNVGFDVTEKMIQDVFLAQGFPVFVRLPLDSETGRHAGFGYVQFTSVSAARAGQEALQGTHIDGHAVNLEISDHSPIIALHPPHNHHVHERNVRSSRRQTVNPSSPGATRGYSSPNNRANTTQGRSFSLLDQETDDPNVATRYPSLQPEASSRSSSSSENLLNLSPEQEMSRFPPVSQLEAHFLANQRETSANNRPAESLPTSETHLQTPTTQLMGEIPNAVIEPAHRDPRSRPLRRSNTVMFTGPRTWMPDASGSNTMERRHGSNMPLRRRATERHSLRHHPHGTRALEVSNNDTSGQNRHSAAFAVGPLDPPGGPHPTRPEPTRPVDDCVSALIDLGYVSTMDGGEQRAAVYAAAAEGNLFDAIGIIEEERKVYEQGAGGIGQ